MKNFITTTFLALSCVVSFAQNTLSLELTHLFNGEEFALNQNYTDNQDRAVKITSTRYYLSSIVVIHDGAQETALEDVYILGEGNVTNYPIDSSYNINSVEGIKLKNKPIFSVQYHPESNPGPQDSVYLFQEFINNMKKNAKKKRT